jgi:hypothetical protein
MFLNSCSMRLAVRPFWASVSQVPMLGATHHKNHEFFFQLSYVYRLYKVATTLTWAHDQTSIFFSYSIFHHLASSQILSSLWIQVRTPSAIPLWSPRKERSASSCSSPHRNIQARFDAKYSMLLWKRNQHLKHCISLGGHNCLISNLCQWDRIQCHREPGNGTSLYLR